MSTAMAWSPYLFLAILLVVSRLPQLPVGDWLKVVRLAWDDIFATGISASTTPFYLPGFILGRGGGHDLFPAPDEGPALRRAVTDSTRVLVGAGFVLVFTVPMVRVYINSEVNGAGFLSMPIAMAEWVATNVGQIWPMFAGVTGAMGAFIAGSNTVSNLMFSAFQYGVADRLIISGVMIVALQAVGAAAGNMIAIHNVVAASATVGLLGREGATLRKTILPTIYYLLVIGIMGLVAVHLMGVSDPLLGSGGGGGESPLPPNGFWVGALFVLTLAEIKFGSLAFLQSSRPSIHSLSPLKRTRKKVLTSGGKKTHIGGNPSGGPFRCGRGRASSKSGGVYAELCRFGVGAPNSVLPFPSESGICSERMGRWRCNPPDGRLRGSP